MAIGLSDLSNLAGLAKSAGGTNPDNKPAPVPSPLEELAKPDVKKTKDWGKIMGFVAKAGTTVMQLKGGSLGSNAASVVGVAGDVAGTVGANANGGGAAAQQTVAGSTVAQRRQQFEGEQAFLDAETQAAGLAITAREQTLLEAEKENQQREIEIAQWEASTARTKQDLKAAKASLKAIEKKITENAQLRERYQSALDYLDESLRSSTPGGAGSEEIKAQWQQKVDALTAKRKELADQHTRWQGVGELLDKGKGRLTALVAN